MCRVASAEESPQKKIGTRLTLRVKKPEGWASENAATRLMQVLKPEPAWVAARTTDVLVEFVAVWGETHQPKFEQLKKRLPAALEQDASLKLSLICMYIQMIISLATGRGFSEQPGRPF